MDDRKYIIQEEGALKKYRTEIPNSVIKGSYSQKLSVHDKFLYVYIKSIIDDKGQCIEGTKFLQINTGMSSGQISKSKQKLCELHLIEIKKGDYHKGQSDRIIIKDIWLKNMIEYGAQLPPSYDEKTSSPGENTPSEFNKDVSSHEKPPSPDENYSSYSSNSSSNNINTTTKTIDFEITSEMNRVIEEWDKTFEIPVNRSNQKLIEHIKKATLEHEIDDIVKAIQYRSLADFYNRVRPDLRDLPSCFFPFPDTIKNDMKRTPFKLINYEEKTELEGKNYSRGANANELQIEKDPFEKDNQGRPMWRFYK